MSEGKVIELIEAEDWFHSCDYCRAQEGGHYCLLHSVQVGNMDKTTCAEWKEKEEEL